MLYCILPVWSEIIPIYDIPVVLHNKCYIYFQITYLLNEISNLTIDNVAVHESLLTAKSLNFICRMLGNSGYSNNSSSILTVCVLSFVVIWEQQMPKQAWHNSWVAANSSATHLKQKEKKDLLSRKWHSHMISMGLKHCSMTRGQWGSWVTRSTIMFSEDRPTFVQ